MVSQLNFKSILGFHIIFILMALNQCYQKALLSITLHQAVNACIPKDDKPQEFLKNWKPISLLSILYKLPSATTVERLKKVLDKLMLNSQKRLN